MTACCGVDVIVFGHPSCALRPPWAASPEGARLHENADVTRRNDWSRSAWAELKRGAEMDRIRAAVALLRGAESHGTAPGHAGMPGSGRQAVSGDPGAAQGHL